MKKIVINPAPYIGSYYGSQDIVEYYENELGLFVTLHSTCYKCYKPLDARFIIFDKTTERFNQSETTTCRCKDCNVYMKKRILVSIIYESEEEESDKE